MALSLEKAQKRSSRRDTPSTGAKKKAPPRPAAKTTAARRPWQGAPRANHALEGEMEFDVIDRAIFLPESLEVLSSGALLRQVFTAFVQNQWLEARRRSYWLSRLTHRQSWIARLKIYPQLRVPLPRALTQRIKN